MQVIEKNIIDALKNTAGKSGTLSYSDFIKTVLYHPTCGYYTSNKKRVGRDESADFYTATSLGPLFGELLKDVVKGLCGPLSVINFVEFGVEASHSTFSNEAKHSFKSYHAIGIHDGVSQLVDDSIIFANELLDAQPFNRLIFLDDEWCELGVEIKADGSLEEIILPELSREMYRVLHQLPKEMPSGYILDLPWAAEQLLYTLTHGSWKGWVVFFDYGYSWKELIENCPQGTGRAYFKHEASKNFLTNPGKQDITCHVCWDRLETILETNGFKRITVDTQEAFFMKYATRAIERIISEQPGTFDAQRQKLKELLHPAHMGRKFQVLWAYRD